MSAEGWRTAAVAEMVAFWQQHYGQTAARTTPGMRPCPDAATAPHGCGLVRQQWVRSAGGAPSYSWTCTLCVERGRSPTTET